MEKNESILLNLLNLTFDKSTISQIENTYLLNLKSVTKWMCFSDYCLDDKTKPNDVITFSIIPYIEDYLLVENFIKAVAKSDIKKASTINEKFIEFLKIYPIINFSFIVNKRKSLFGNNHEEIKKNLKHEYLAIRGLYELWIVNEPEKEAYYKTFLKRIDSCINLIDNNKKIKQLIDVILIPFLGGYVSNVVLNRVDKLEIYGWFSDRDQFLDIEKGIALTLFQNNLHGLIDNKNFEFVTSLANCNFDIFYDQFIKIPDYIVGTLADYNLENNQISKEKFNTVLTNYMGDNQFNNYVFRIFKESNIYNCGKILITKK
jgi:hypothetical protein